MKNSFHFPRRKNQAMTRIEILVVLFGVFILLLALMPFNWRVRTSHPFRTKLEVADLVMAIQAYHAAYGRYPVPTNIEDIAAATKGNFTYGGPMLDAILGSNSATPLNADVIAILMDYTNFPDGKPTINTNYNLNPQKIQFLNAKLSGNIHDPGVGMDLVYRDSWGHPYIISINLNGDHHTRDAFYKNHLVSQKNGAAGFGSLTNSFDASGATDLFEYEGDVMVWSLGPDGKADVSKSSILPPNKDNIVSWE